ARLRGAHEPHGSARRGAEGQLGSGPRRRHELDRVPEHGLIDVNLADRVLRGPDLLWREYLLQIVERVSLQLTTDQLGRTALVRIADAYGEREAIQDRKSTRLNSSHEWI